MAKIIIAHSHKHHKSICALIGKGNNGGDALVACAHLAEQGWEVTALALTGRPRDEYSDRLQSNGGRFLSEDESLQRLCEQITKHNVLLDGILGTGFRLPLRDELAGRLSAIKGCIKSSTTQRLVVAVDSPSGLDLYLGQAADDTLNANLTVSMAAIKNTMLTPTAFPYLGTIEVADIGLQSGLPEWDSITRISPDSHWIRSHMPERPIASHKGTYGTCLVIGGSSAYPGAPLLAGQSAGRTGAGLITFALPSAIKEALVPEFPEAIWLPLAKSLDYIDGEDSSTILEQINAANSALIGPGMGTNKASAAFFDFLLNQDIETPMVIDADGLKLLGLQDKWSQRLPAQTILTPHPGEMQTLTGIDKDSIQANRMAIAEDFAQKWNKVVLLKGAFSIIASPEGRTAILPYATSALATAGTGDVLSGIIVSLLAQGLQSFEAATLGATIHAQAALAATSSVGAEASLIASDLLKEIPHFLT